VSRSTVVLLFRDSMTPLGYIIESVTTAVNYIAWTIVENSVSNNVSPAINLRFRIYVLHSLHSILKWALHRITKVSQIVRISRGADKIPYDLCIQYIIGQLFVSRRLQAPISTLLDQGDPGQLVRSVASIKSIDPDSDSMSYLQIGHAVGILSGIHQTERQLDEKAHEEAKKTARNDQLLCEAYKCVSMFLDNSQEKVEKQWVKLGFQGSNPYRDFRGTGEFGLECFYHFCTVHSQVAAKIIRESGSSRDDFNDSRPWYSCALVSINISQYVLHLLDCNYLYKLKVLRALQIGMLVKPQEVKSFDVDSSSCEVTQKLIDQVYHLHSRLVIEFHDYWMVCVDQGIVTSVLETESVLAQFKRLAERSSTLS
jgi:ELMO/CED-12 family